MPHHVPAAPPGLNNTGDTPVPPSRCRLPSALCLLPSALCLLPTALCLLLLAASCAKRETVSTPADVERPLAGLKLRLLVAGDAEIAAAAGQLRGEWAAQTGSELEVAQISEKELENAEALAADAVICPSYQLGPLAERKRIIPLSKKMLDGIAGEWSGIFELLRLREASWGEQVYAVPFGSPVLTCYYRADLLAKVGRRPPRTWAEYQQLAELLADRKNLADAAPAADAPWSGTVEPLGPGWAGLVLLARVAPYAKHRSNYSALFDIRTMEPLIAGPPTVRALEELVAAAKVGAPDQLQADPAAARAAFWKGQCGMVLSWPTAAIETRKNNAAKASTPDEEKAPGDKAIEVGFVELPGSRAVFDVGNRSWSTRTEEEDPHVVLLGVAGRIGAVSTSAAQPEAALQLLLWLSGDQMSTQVCAASPATTLFRRAHVKSPRGWTESVVSAAGAVSYAAATEQTLGREQWLCALRIPGRSEYLAALDEAVEQAVRGKQSAMDALFQAAKRWQQITERLGVESQRAAYTHAVGLE